VAKSAILDNIAMAAGVPVRTLLDSFRRFRSTTPMQYVRDQRLDHARSLLEMRDTSDSITSIALNVGFTHLGRFFSFYRIRFGERPIDTLRNVRSG